MRYLISFFGVVLIACVQSFSQNSFCECTGDNEREMNVDGNLTAKIYISPSLNRKELYYGSWGIGEVELIDGTVVKDKILRYNGYLDELVWLRDADKKTGLVDKQLVKSFRIFNKEYGSIDFFKKFKIKHWYSLDTSVVYMHVLAEGKLSLYVSRKIIQMSNSQEYVTKHEYYLYRDSNFIPFKPNRVYFLQILGSEKEKMKLILRVNHLKVRKENQLLRAIEIYNKNNLN
jgi:hypothetical protein